MRHLIERHTRVIQPPLVPELSIRAITADCPLWRADERGADAAGLPWPFWAFAWPGGQALARYVLDHVDVVAGRSVLDFGAGCGIAGLAAAAAGARDVLCADIDPVAASATEINAELNGLALRVTRRDLVADDGEMPEAPDVILVGDMYYDADEAGRFTRWLRRLSQRGALVLAGDPDRGFLEQNGWIERLVYQAPADNDGGVRARVRTRVLELRRDRHSA